ncbi:hypothetical protein M427DRAFT_56295 [Gonapodya prolifera JEL478]|uniref:Uncharacterized protein n=1 Tax=Gonapodya prolifera (strain JEL478) TaxID=1344416 RepID=A0A139AHW5_GONPJ|nr:hypothetical protein M427DRAFT_56295 [Gonapodya prolifera JEL478]|eukprot:KXS16003.1 hypothetical protein M427DRAFT_56295 [Gonapodya prolifera JEL478]
MDDGHTQPSAHLNSLFRRLSGTASTGILGNATGGLAGAQEFVAPQVTSAVPGSNQQRRPSTGDGYGVREMGKASCVESQNERPVQEVNML